MNAINAKKVLPPSGWSVVMDNLRMEWKSEPNLIEFPMYQL